MPLPVERRAEALSSDAERVALAERVVADERGILCPSGGPARVGGALPAGRTTRPPAGKTARQIEPWLRACEPGDLEVV